MSSETTREALLDATIELIGAEGMRAVSVRRVTTLAGVNQALVSYHFNGLDGLLEAAYERGANLLFAEHSEALEQARTFADLHQVGAELANRSRHDKSAAVLANVIAAAYHDPAQARNCAAALEPWRAAIASAMARVLAHHGLDTLVDPEQLAGPIAAGVLGMVLTDGLDPAPFGQTLQSLGEFAAVADGFARLIPSPTASLFGQNKPT